MNVLVTEPYSLTSLARLRADFQVSTDPRTLPETEILLVRSRTRVDREFLERAPKLKLIVTATSGFDHIDWREARARDVIVAHTPDANAASTAELTLGLMIAQERKLVGALKNVRGNQWREGLPRPAGLDGKLLGVVGLGRVGRRVARLAGLLGMKIQAYDPYVGEEAFAECGAERIGFTELLRSSDIVTLHVPLTNETLHLLNKPTFHEMQSEAYLVNTCRGPVVDENDLMVALDEGVIAGAAMDVIEREPPPRGHRLLTHPKLILTPHIGAFTESAWEKASQEAVAKVLAYKKGEPVLDTLPLAVPWFEKT